MTEIIKELDAALSTKEKVSKLAEKYPDAPDESLENAKRLEELKHNLGQLRREAERQQEAEVKAIRQALGQTLENSVNELEEKVAVLAVSTGTATGEEERLVAELSTDASNASDELAKFFTPNSGTRYVSNE